MPGRRLTGADRRQISGGLAQGLDYAEIARRLGRPTSTVMREVARNGGPGRYSAELAQLATIHRARRRPRPAAAQRISEDSGPDPHMTAAFMAEFTAALIETGLPRTAAGVLACLFASETGSCTAAELAQRLQVSAATISHAVGLLEKQALIRRGRDDRGRRHRYFIDDDAGVRSAVVGVRANQRLAATALRGADMFGADTDAGARLAMTGRLLEQIGNDIIRSAQRHWRAATGKELGDARAYQASAE
ncbi:MarR family protein [Saccharopolyspora shandongensis]|uniref:MarR family protein n=1 Tax=Saccharopolyspora shandongensis TaxID=418495 RepID=A0A1H3TBX9_9PSEU|nr:helix-turn-helix domain-containing protein [Saccharopolyspora shandongensis]SDZ47368.1 MarR family protein [Saccharopolyspora shandongensis]